MSSKKPNCQEFILQAIREIRRNPSNLKPDARAGVKLNRLWDVARNIFTEDEFRHSLNSLLENDIVLVTWKVRNQRGKNRYEKATKLSMSTPLETERWHREKPTFHNTDSSANKVRYETVHKIMLYITADGLPEKVKKISTLERYSLATKIVAETNDR